MFLDEAITEMRINGSEFMGTKNKIFYQFCKNSLYSRQDYSQKWEICCEIFHDLYNQSYFVVENNKRIGEIFHSIRSLDTKTEGGNLFRYAVTVTEDNCINVGLISEITTFTPLDLINVSFNDFKKTFPRLIPVFHYLIELALIRTKQIVY